MDFNAMSQRNRHSFVKSLGNSFKMWEILYRFCCFAVANQRNLAIFNRNMLT